MFDVFGNGPSRLRRTGVKKATTFTGFCSSHDKSTFQAIEDGAEPDTFTERQMFLFAYRAFAIGYAAKRSYFSALSELHKTRFVSSEEMESVRLGIRDLKQNKRIFDSALVSKVHCDLLFHQRSINISANIGVSGYLSVDKDLDGRVLFDLYSMPTMRERVPMIALSVLPRNGSLSVLASYFRCDASVYAPVVNAVFSMGDQRLLQAISYWTVTYAENWVVRPSHVESWSQRKRGEIESWFDETMGPSHPYLEFIKRIESIF